MAKTVTGIALEGMPHLALVANVMTAIGAPPPPEPVARAEIMHRLQGFSAVAHLYRASSKAWVDGHRTRYDP